jgi:hypothetical protein
MSEPSLLARFLDIFIKQFLRVMREKRWDFVLAGLAVFYFWAIGGFTGQAWRDNFWKVLTPIVWMVCAIGIVHVIFSATVLIQQIENEISPIILLDEHRTKQGEQRKAVPEIPYYRAKVLTVALVSIGLLLMPALGTWHWARNYSIRPNPPEPAPVSIYLGCRIDHIPIHIPAASTIHIIRLDPRILSGNPRIRSLGVFENVSSRTDASLDLPSKSDGRWMTPSEFRQAVIKEKKFLPSPYASKCSVSVYGAPVVEDVVATLIIETSDGKQHAYPVAFDPFVSNSSFTFYVINICSSGSTVRMVHWADRATLHVLGEPDKREVPLKYVKRGWPAELLPMFGPSSFIWNGVQACNWDSK